MKVCLICHEPADDSAETCANCGEGSWESLESTPAASEPPPAPTKISDARKPSKGGR